MADKEQIADEMRKVLLDIEFNKFNDERKTELKQKYEELKLEYRNIVSKENKDKTI